MSPLKRRLLCALLCVVFASAEGCIALRPVGRAVGTVVKLPFKVIKTVLPP